MDLLRSCYETEMRFWSDSSLSIPVRWFFADADAKIFPGHHRFASGNWASDRDNWPGPGEVLGAPRTWSNGNLIGNLPGRKFCGPRAAFEDGASLADPALYAGENGVACCCKCVDCPCIAWSASQPPTLQVRITAVRFGGVSPLGFVGQRFLLHRDDVVTGSFKGPAFQQTIFPFATVFMWLWCFQPPTPFESVKAFGIYPVPGLGRSWDEERCVPLRFTITAYPLIDVIGTLEEWDLVLEVPDDTH